MSNVIEHRIFTECPFALLNPVEVDRSLWADLPHHPLMPVYVGVRTKLFPLLIDLRGLAVTSRIEIAERAWAWERAYGSPFFCALIESADPVERMVRHLSRRLLIKNAGGQHQLLRFYDPRVFEHLRWILTATQLASVMGPAETWYWRDEDGQWQRETRPEVKSYRLTLEPQQLLSLGRVGILNRTLKHLRRLEPGRAIDGALVRKIDTWLRLAYEAGLSDAPDVQLYALQALRFHPNIHHHPKLQAALQAVHKGHSTYVGACMDVDEQELRESKEAQ